MTPRIGFDVGDRIRNRETGKVATVTHRAGHCGNVYIGDYKTEISPSAWEPVPADAPTQEPVAEPVASNGGNGHKAEWGLPPLRSFKGRVGQTLGRQKERV